MNVICLMGGTGSGKSYIERALGKMGYKVCISYTTREPRVRNGIPEVNGEDYWFINRDEFMSLVDSGSIIEYQEYAGNLYGTPRLFGSTHHVVTVCTQGFRSLKAIYGEQVIGVYVKTDFDTARGRSGSELYNSRKEEDIQLISEMESESNLTVNGCDPVNKIVADILSYVRSKGMHS